MEESLVVDSLKQAVHKRIPDKGLIIHSDRGGQYAGTAFKEALSRHHCIQSMSGADNPTIMRTLNHFSAGSKLNCSRKVHSKMWPMPPQRYSTTLKCITTPSACIISSLSFITYLVYASSMPFYTLLHRASLIVSPFLELPMTNLRSNMPKCDNPKTFCL